MPLGADLRCRAPFVAASPLSRLPPRRRGGARRGGASRAWADDRRHHQGGHHATRPARGDARGAEWRGCPFGSHSGMRRGGAFRSRLAWSPSRRLDHHARRDRPRSLPEASLEVPARLAHQPVVPDAAPARPLEGAHQRALAAHVERQEVAVDPKALDASVVRELKAITIEGVSRPGWAVPAPPCAGATTQRGGTDGIPRVPGHEQAEDLRPNAAVRGILPDCLVTVVSVQWFGSEAVELTNETSTGQVANGLLFRHDERVAEHDRVALPPARGAISQHCAPCSVRRRPAAHLDGLDLHPVRGSDAS